MVDKQATLEQVYEASFNNEFEKAALSYNVKANYIKAMAKKTAPFRKALGQKSILKQEIDQVAESLSAANLPKKGIFNRIYRYGGRAQIDSSARSARGTYDYLKGMPAAARG